MMNEEKLLSYLDGTLKDADRAAVEEWYVQSLENKKTLNDLYFIWSLERKTNIIESIDVDKSYAKFRKLSQPKRSHRKFFSFYKIAAAVVFIGLIFFLGKLSESNISTDSSSFVLETGLGDRVQTTLEDGTKVWIGSSSKLTYQQTSLFSKERVVHLDGEAYFDVRKNDTPFSVTSKGIKVSVLGTRFNIKSNSDESKMVTTLLEGSIKITNPNAFSEEIVMKPNQQFIYDSSTLLAELEDCQTAKESISWIDGKLVFHKATLIEIVKGLERNYNVDIKLSDKKLEEKLFTCEFDAKDNIHHILSILAMTKTIKYDIEDNRHVTIYPVN